MVTFFRILFAASLLAGVGCDSSPTTIFCGTEVCCGSPDVGALNAVIDGAAYRGAIGNAFLSSGTLNIASDNCAETVSVNFSTLAQVGTVTEAQGASAQVETADGSGVTGVWRANDFQGSATITVVTLTSTGATGTFSFSAPASGLGATGTKVVMSGTFNAGL